jgi:transcriptional regulator with XRE-family HTH domain
LDDIENGRVSISIEMLFAILKVLDISVRDLSAGLNQINDQNVPRHINAEQNGKDLKILFRYAKYNACYYLKDARLSEFESVLKALRDGLAKLDAPESGKNEALKTEAVANAFKIAVKSWPDANPSDIWWFIIYRAYLDPFNHPAKFSRLSFEQSWKRTGGWALEEVLVRHYALSLKKQGINLFIAPNEKRIRLLAQANVDHRLEADKADVFLTGEIDGEEIFFGIVHVKASFAERRTDDVPMSKALVDGGYASPLWTMDCKSSPAFSPKNKGELGVIKAGFGPDKRSAKRKDIEDDGFFSACFSYNLNTNATPVSQNSRARIYVCDFNNPEGDSFFNYICDSWVKFQESIG